MGHVFGHNLYRSWDITYRIMQVVLYDERHFEIICTNNFST